jgi:3-carboxymethyl-3-hydroxy-acyl-[acp] dehydratase
MENYNLNTLKVRLESDVGYLQIYRPDANNTINDELIKECHLVLDEFRQSAKIVVVEGLPQVFCFGADFKGMVEHAQNENSSSHKPNDLYQLWLTLAQGPFVSIAKVEGKVNAGGVGFVCACDIVLSHESVMFSLSELLFSLMPACVMPFLIQKVGRQKAHYMTLMTMPVSAKLAHDMGLVDMVGGDADELLRRHLLRLSRLTKTGITRYKDYLNSLDSYLSESQNKAIMANQQVFSDTQNLEKIVRYVNTGLFPWEDD